MMQFPNLDPSLEQDLKLRVLEMEFSKLTEAEIKSLLLNTMIEIMIADNKIKTILKHGNSKICPNPSADSKENPESVEEGNHG